MKKPSFSRLSKIEEQGLLDKLRVARELISHPAEKGRSLEIEVAAAIRELLPAEYGVGTGFIAYHGEEGPVLSSQLDIIIFDAVRGGPLARLASCEIYPIEAVFCYVEVKASLSLPGPKSIERDNSIQNCMSKNHEIRKMRTRKYWDMGIGGSPIDVRLMSFSDWLPIRAFVFAFEIEGKAASDQRTFAIGMANAAKKHAAHIHGVLVLDQVYLTTIPVDTRIAEPEDYYHVLFTTEHPFTAFKIHLLKALGSYQKPREGSSIAWESYFDLPSEWERVEPQ